MSSHIGGCPLCGGKEGYLWGTNLPCEKCESGYKSVIKQLPEGTSIRMWYEAKEAAKKVLAEGGTEKEAQAKLYEIVMHNYERRKKEREREKEARRLAAKPEDPRINQLFEGLKFPD